MNSSNLQRLFSEEYEDFFAKNNLIVSCPQVINRGNIIHLEGIQEKLAQKLPTKFYIGINIRNDDRVKFKTISQFVATEKRFEKKDIETNGDKKMIEKMEQEIKEKLVELGYTKGINISVLSENEKGTGTAMASVESLLISFIIHILSEKISQEQLDDYTGFLQSKEFKNIYTMAKDMLGEISPIPKKNINGTILFTAAVNNGNTGLGFPHKEYLQKNYTKVWQFENSMCLEHTHLDQKKIIEYSIINFGSFFGEFYNTETYFKIQKEYEDIIKYYGVEKSNADLFTNTLNFLYLNFFQTAKDAMLQPTDEHLVNKFFGQSCRYQISIL